MVTWPLSNFWGFLGSVRHMQPNRGECCSRMMLRQWITVIWLLLARWYLRLLYLRAQMLGNNVRATRWTFAIHHLVVWPSPELVWSYNANNTLNLHKWSSSNILASMDSFWCLLSKSAGTPATTLGHFFLFRMPDLDLFKIQNLINSDEIIQIGIVLPPVVITNITFTLKFAHDLIRSS